MLATGLALVLAGALGACGDDDDDDAAADETAGETTSSTAAAATEPAGPSVAFTEPADGATVTSPVTVKMAATDYLIEPAGDGTVKEGSGHFHVMIDTPCIAPGTVIPSDDTHKHFGMAQLETTLELPAGEHTLCLQVADAAHTATDLTDEVKITVQ
jgi:hypothetical protein